MEGLEVEILEGEGSIQTLKDICQFPRITPQIYGQALLRILRVQAFKSLHKQTSDLSGRLQLMRLPLRLSWQGRHPQKSLS